MGAGGLRQRLPDWIDQMRRVAGEHPATGACTVATAMELWAWTFDHLRGGRLHVSASDAHSYGPPLAEALGGLLSSRAFVLESVPGGDPVKNLYPGSEHADAMLIERFGPEPDAPLRIAMAASDLGFIFMDVNGRLLAQHRSGHAQWISAARFRPAFADRSRLWPTKAGPARTTDRRRHALGE